MFAADAAPFEPPSPSSAIHIIWNLLLTDKLTPLTPALISENKIAHILAILPTAAEYSELATQIPDVPYTVLDYGEEHTPKLPKERYDRIGEFIDAIARRPITEGARNILIFCNNGYQRSLPFLAYYLIKFHADEVPTLERAVDLILPQVNRTNYAAERDGIIAALQTVFEVQNSN